MTTLANTQSISSLLNINEVSKVCGLSPSVLRIWELRYGWPHPRRRTNGYRAYSALQAQELKRICGLVRAGKLISELIVDGLPRWPAESVQQPTLRDLPLTKAFPRSESVHIRQVQDGIIESLDMRSEFVIQEHVQRAVLLLRPVDEPVATLMPVLHAIAEARHNRRPFATESFMIEMVVGRIAHLSRKLKDGTDPLQIVPIAGDLEHVAAQLIALVLHQRGIPAKYSASLPTRRGTWVAVGEGDATQALGRVTILGGENRTSLVDVVSDQRSPKWLRDRHN